MRQLGKLGVWYPIDRLDAAGIRRLLRTVEDLGYSTFWYPEGLRHIAVRRARSVGASGIVRPLRLRSATCSSPQREARGAFGLK